MPIADTDPRVFFAAERTLLAWLRTGLTIIGVGFLVARFGLFVRLMTIQIQVHPLPENAHLTPSAFLGVAFVALGALCVLVATAQHRRFVATLVLSDLPAGYDRRFAVLLSAAVGVLGLVLAVYLVVSQT